MIYTPKCTCSCPKSFHSHVGCSGCCCPHGIPSTEKELKGCKFEDFEIEVWLPEEFQEKWDRDNPNWAVEDFVSLNID